MNSREYGEQNVGLITGDRVITIMQTYSCNNRSTTNMIHENNDRVKEIKYIILDEIHYISNKIGTVWEEVIIFKHKGTKLIGLSATIPQYR